MDVQGPRFAMMRVGLRSVRVRGTVRRAPVCDTRRCSLSTRALVKGPEAVISEVDRLAGSLAEAAAHRDVQEPDELPVYTHRRPLGSIQRATAQLYSPDAAFGPGRAPNVVYLTHELHAEQVLPDALQRCGTVARAIGFDLEWSVVPYPSKAAVMQLGISNTIYVLHLAAMRRVPRCIVEMMADPSWLKVGVAIRNDAHKLRRDFQMVSKGLVELSTMAKELDSNIWRHRRLLISLRDLCTTYLRRTLRKDAVRVSEWTHVPLSSLQLEYAASDAFVSLELFHQMVLLAYQRRMRHAMHEPPASLAHTPLESTLAMVRKATSNVCAAPTPKSKPRAAIVKAEEAICTTHLRSHERALRAWRTKQFDFPTIAARAGIQIGTSAGYVMRALAEELAARRAAGHPDTQLDAAERARLRVELGVPQVRRTIRYHYLFLRNNGVFSAEELQTMQ